MSRLNFDKAALFTLKISPSAVNANTVAQQTFTVNGLQVGDVVLEVSKPTVQSGLFVVSGQVTAANTLGITFGNCTSGNITPTAGEVYTVMALRPDMTATASAAVFN